MSVKEILFDRKLIRLLRIRWTGQLTDGIFQSALASFVLFSPERQADAMSAALAFALVLVPYSIVGPFVGTILDRFSRQRALFFANLTRATTLAIIALLIFQGRTGIELTVFVLIAFGVNRLILAGLSAGLPLVISREKLITANAFVVVERGDMVDLREELGDLLLQVVFHAQMAREQSLFDFGDVVEAICAKLIRRHPHVFGEARDLTPDQVKDVWGEIKRQEKVARAAARAAAGALAEPSDGALSGVPAGMAALTRAVKLRNKFNDPLDTEAGLAGVTFMIVTAAVGFVFGAIIAPFGVSKVGRHRWMQLAMGASALSVIALAITRTSLTLALTAFFTALCGQSVKVTNDALVQSKIDDIFRGRVFAVYDVVVNFAIVFGALLAAVLLPTNGDTWTLPTVIGIGYLATSLIILRPAKFFIRSS